MIIIGKIFCADLENGNLHLGIVGRDFNQLYDIPSDRIQEFCDKIG